MADRKKIIYFIGSMRRGGAEGQVLHLLRHFRNREFDASLYLLSATGEHLPAVKSMGARVRDFNFEKRHHIADPRTSLQVAATLRQIGRALREDRPDLLHCFLYWANIFGTWAGRRAGVPRIVTSRRSLGLYKDGRPWMQWIENWSNRWVSAATVNSEAVRRDTLRRERIDPGKVKLILNGVDPNQSADEDAIRNFRRRWAGGSRPDDETKVILCVANLIHYKGHLTLLEAMAEVAQAAPKSRLILAGRDGGMEVRIRERIEQLGLQSRVRLIGLQEDLAPVYAASDIVVHPSDEEGFSNVVLEAMAARKPIVATRVGGVPEAIEDGCHGLLVAPRDPAAMARALIKLLRDEELGLRLASAARARVETEFSLDAMLANYEDFYRAIMA